MINLSFFLICYLISTEDTVPEVSKKILQYGHTQHQGLLFSLRIENSEWESSQKKKKTQQINKIISGDSSAVLRAKKKVTLCLMQETFTHLLSEPFQVLTVAGVCYMPAGIKRVLWTSSKELHARILKVPSITSCCTSEPTLLPLKSPFCI